MEYEIRDDPQGLEERDHANRDGGLVEDHVALERQRSTRQAGYREHDRTGECKKIPGWVVVNPTTVQSMSDERLCEITRPGWRHISSEVQALKGEGQKA